MRNHKYTILHLAFVFLGTYSLSAQISIPYGNDAIGSDDTEIDLRFELDGRDWDCRYVSYIFLNGTEDIADDQEQEAVRRAFSSWSAITNLDFIEVCNENDADIRIGWFIDDHGDPCNDPEDCFFDDEGGTLAHAFFPPPNLGMFAGDIHFDEDEDWSLTVDTDMETVALHEIGHAIGLRHSDVNNSVMEEFYEGERRELTNDDISGIREIYGQRENPIIGSNLICDVENYTLDDFDCLRAGFNVTWSVSNNITIQSGQGTANIEVSTTANQESGFIRATINSGCDELVFTKNVWLGLPEANLYYSAEKLCVGQTIQVFAFPINGNAEIVSWWTTGALETALIGSSSVYVKGLYHGLGTVFLNIRNECGVTTERIHINVQPCEGGPFLDVIKRSDTTDSNGEEENVEELIDSFVLFPNPVENTLTVICDEIKSAEKVNIVVISAQGKIVKDYSSLGSFHKINLSDLSTGIYIVRCEVEGKTYHKKILKM